MVEGLRVKVWGDFALFTRPEFKVERVSYDVITPSAARGILEAIHWKPAIRWVVDRIRVLRPIRFDTLCRNEVGAKVSYQTARASIQSGEAPNPLWIDEQRQQRASTLLRDVAYVIEAHFVMTEHAGADDTPGKHADMAQRRLARGQCVQQPALGCREFPAYFAPAEPADLRDPADESLWGERDLGWMLHDIDFVNGMTPRFFRAVMRNGVVEVPPFAPGTAA